MEDDWPCDDDACGEAEADVRCDYCDRPATWHAAWKTAAMPATAFAYACDLHRFAGMVPIDEPIQASLDHLPTAVDREDAG
jgi:hypothetical protein